MRRADYDDTRRWKLASELWLYWTMYITFFMTFNCTPDFYPPPEMLEQTPLACLPINLSFIVSGGLAWAYVMFEPITGAGCSMLMLAANRWAFNRVKEPVLGLPAWQVTFPIMLICLVANILSQPKNTVRSPKLLDRWAHAVFFPPMFGLFEFMMCWGYRPRFYYLEMRKVRKWRERYAKQWDEAHKKD